MFSVIVHGRNDSYGYNLHRRVALSLNCLAHLLDGTDEIIFVDWNTPDALPTLPEAINDTLTEQTRQRLRILRVRPRLHESFRASTHLPVLDTIARNVAIRRSDPANPWLLSTTTDIVLVPAQGGSLRESLGELPEVLHHAARFDLPE